jgi:ribokinase
MDIGAPPRLFTVGSIVADIRLEVPHLPVRGGDVLASAGQISAGGGFNILCAAARQGLRCIFAGRHGSGPYGRRIRAELAREGVIAFLDRAPIGDTGFCIVLVEPGGERTFVTSPGVEADLARRRLADLPLAPQDTVFASGYDLSYPELGHAIAAWMAKTPPTVRFVVDPGPLVADISTQVMALVMPRASVWSMNLREAELLTGTAAPDAVRSRMRPSLARDALLVLRDGPRGAWISTSADEATRRIPARRVSAVDTTGAGDAHSGVLIASLAAGLQPAEAVRRANAAAALSVTRAGPATAPTSVELDRFLAAQDRHATAATDLTTDFNREEA